MSKAQNPEEIEMDQQEIQENARIMQKAQRYQTLRFQTALELLRADYPRRHAVIDAMTRRAPDPEDPLDDGEQAWDEDDASGYLDEAVTEALWAAELLLLRNDAMDIPFLSPPVDAKEDKEDAEE